MATFLPWTTFYAGYVDGGEGTRSFSGWDLVTDCASRRFPGQCLFEDQSISPEFVPDEVVAGDWALLAGVLLVATGLTLAAARRRGRPFAILIVLGWVVAAAALACGIVTLALFVEHSNGVSGGPSIEFGAAIAAASPVIALLGLGLVQTARARERAVELERSST